MCTHVYKLLMHWNILIFDIQDFSVMHISITNKILGSG